ncbi:MAG: PepSY domain-containing protein [Methanomicrobiales archaeon]
MMKNSKVLVSIGVVLMIGVVAAGYQITNNQDQWQLADLQQNNNPADTSVSNPSTSVQGQTGSGDGTTSGQSQSSNGGSNMKISPSEAKTLAQNYVQTSGVSTGTPKLVEMGGIPTYVVPLISDGKVVGEIYIDPETGKNVGGAGGAP